jgi:hypothetical protein
MEWHVEFPVGASLDASPPCAFSLSPSLRWISALQLPLLALEQAPLVWGGPDPFAEGVRGKGFMCSFWSEQSLAGEAALPADARADASP